jgi:RNA polymerase sigma-70 factor (ECF subfamily)
MLTDAMLIARVVHDDDRAAFGELVRRHQPMVRGFLRRMLGSARDGALADDLAQETFIKAHRALRGFRGSATFASWLCAIASNELRGEWRRRKRRAEFQEDESVEAAALGTEPGLAHDLANGLSQLTEAQRAALVLCCEHGLTHEEAAQAMGCPVGTVKSHVARGKARLRAWLELEETT